MPDESWKHIGVSLSEEEDAALRQNLRGKGDLSKRFREALQNPNWCEVPLMRRRLTGGVWKRSAFAIDMVVYENLKKCARKRGVELAVLIDAIIISYDG